MAEDTGKLGETPFMRTARARFKLADEADTKQRERERNDLAFYAGEQWPADIKLLRQGQQPTNGMPAVPARPTLTINNLREPVRQVLNEERQSDLGIEIIAADDFGDLGVTPDDSEIKLREGIARRIQRQSSAADARTWAYSRAVISGRGYYQVMTRYLPGKTFDQEVYIHRIYNQASVLLDPSHTEPDGSDARWGFVGVDMLWDKYVEEFPKIADGKDNPMIARLGSDPSDDAWRACHDEYPDWFRAISDSTGGEESTKATKAVRVTDYWYLESENRDLSILRDGTYAWANELPDDHPRMPKKATDDQLAALPPNAVMETRSVVQQVVKWAKIDGVNELDKVDWPGPDLPIVKVLGEELQPYDSEHRVEGMIRPSRDSQMGTNYMVSKLVETVGLTPIPPLQVDPDAIDGFEEWYKVANTRALPYLPSRTYDDSGRPLKEPHRPAVDPNLLPISQSIALFMQFTEKTTAVPAAALGDIDPVTRSGKAITALTLNAQRSTSNFLDNLIRSLRYEGQIINNLLYPIYGARPGRIVRMMTGANQPETWMIQPPQGPPGQPGAPQPPPGMQIHGQAKLTPDANFNIAIKVARNYDTRRQELETTLGEIISKDPQYGLSVFGDLFFKYQDGPGHLELSDRAKLMLAPPVQQMLAAQARGGAFDPKDQMIQQLQQKLQQAGQIIQGKQAEKAAEMGGKMQIAHMQETFETQRHREDNETKLAVAELGAKVDRLALFLEERGRVGAQIHEAGMQQTDQAHEAALAHAQAGHEQDQAAQEQAMQTQQMGHDAAMGVMQAAPPQPAAEPQA
jgi:hypothetical protein